VSYGDQMAPDQHEGCNARIAQLERELAEAKEEIGVLNRRRGGECDTCGKWVCPPIRCVGCMMKQRLTPHANPEPLAADVLAAATRRAEEAEGAVKVLAEEVDASRHTLEEVKNQRTYENKNNIVPGGCVSSLLETWCKRLVRSRESVAANPIASAALAATVRKEET